MKCISNKWSEQQQWFSCLSHNTTDAPNHIYSNSTETSWPKKENKRKERQDRGQRTEDRKGRIEELFAGGDGCVSVCRPRAPFGPASPPARPSTINQSSLLQPGQGCIDLVRLSKLGYAMEMQFSIQFTSLHFTSIRFDSIRFDSFIV
jgi:hypothetical protein